MTGMHRLEHLRERRTFGVDALARTAVSDAIGVSWRSAFHSRRTPPAFSAEAEQHLDHRAGRKVLAQIAVDLRGRRLHVLQHLLQQHVIAIRQHLDQLVQRLLLVVLHLGRNLDQLGRLTLAIAIRPLAHHIDIAAHRLAIHDRHLAQHQRRAGISLQGRERIAHAAFQRVDLVDEHHVRHAVISQLLEHRRNGQRAGRRRLAHHHGEIHHRQRTAGFIGEFDRAGTVQHRPRIAEIRAMAQPDLGGRRTIARIGRPLDRGAGSLHQRLEQRRLAAAVRPDQRHRAGTSAVLCS